MIKSPILLDTNLLSIFAELGRLDLLFTLLTDHKLYISPTIQQELIEGARLGHIFLQDILNLVGYEQLIGIAQPASIESELLANLPVWMARGEAECIVICQHRGWIFASNDHKAINYCKRNKIAQISLNAVLAALWRSGLVTKNDVRQIIDELEQGGRPISAKTEILQE